MEQKSTAVSLGGSDDTSETFEFEGRILRGIRPQFANRLQHVVDSCARLGLFRQAIVSTHVAEHAVVRAAGLTKFPLVLEHEKIPFVTYPHEWTAPMLKDAALLHVEVMERLLPLGLTLRDWHPWNILFQRGSPVFVDVSSIIPYDALAEEPYLTSIPSSGFAVDPTLDAFDKMSRSMLIPYFLLPLSAASRAGADVMRRKLLDAPLNCAGRPLSPHVIFGRWTAARVGYELHELSRRAQLHGHTGKAQRYLRSTRRTIERIDATPPRSNYLAYYKQKGEALPILDSMDWKPKQRVVDSFLREHVSACGPDSRVLDLASNVGWFSRLAAHHGATVLAVDMDDSCLEVVRHDARARNARIDTASADILNFSPAVFPTLGSTPFLRSAHDRFQSDIVIALAIVHHLVLGGGTSLTAVLDRLASLSSTALLIEFIPIDDDRVQSEKSFFRSLYRGTAPLASYTLEAAVSHLRTLFAVVKVEPSSPSPRMFIHCVERIESIAR